MQLVLASGSPRRAELLRSIGVEFRVLATDIDESPLASETATSYVNRVANAKCLAAQAMLGATDHAIVLAADTTVAIDGDILGKPADDEDARRMLRRLSGRSHDVHTAVCVATPTDIGITRVTTSVVFASLSTAEIDWYVGRGESLDKAGAYGMQTAGALLVVRIDGSPTNVIGLPLRETVAMLQAAGIKI